MSHAGTDYRALGPATDRVVAGVLEREGFRRLVALKRPSGPTATERRAVVREAQLLQWLEHPAIVRALDLVELSGAPTLVLEFVRGARLADLSHPVPWPLAAHIGARIASAMAHAEMARDGRGRTLATVHRDLSPSNVLLTPTGRVVVIDFGIAHCRLHNRTRSGTVRGTPGYLSPEQARGELVDSRSDVFTIGVLLCVLLGGRPPTDVGDYPALAAQIASLACPEALRPVLRSALAINRARRLPLGEFADALDELSGTHAGTPRALGAYVSKAVPEQIAQQDAWLRTALGEVAPPSSGAARFEGSAQHTLIETDDPTELDSGR